MSDPFHLDRVLDHVRLYGYLDGRSHALLNL
jgi:hypothetical protein